MCWCISNAYVHAPSSSSRLLCPACLIACLLAALPKGGITPDHVLIIPISHTPSLAGASPGLREEVERFKTALGRMFASQGGKGMVAFERVLHSRRGETPQHTHMQVVPVPAATAATAQAQLIMESQFRYTPLSELPTSGEGVDPLPAAVALPSQPQQQGESASADGAAPPPPSTGTVEYFYIECPAPAWKAETSGAETAGAASSGEEGAPAASTAGEDVPMATAPSASSSSSSSSSTSASRPPFSRLLHVVPPGTKHPVQFGREMVCRLLAAPDRLSWKACALSQEAEAAQAEAFRQAFAPFDFTAEL